MYKWTISFKGETKINKDGSRKLEINEFIFENKYFKPKETIHFLITEEPDGWLYIKNDNLAIREGGDTFEQAIENAIVHIVDKYEHLLSTPDEELGKLNLSSKREFEHWGMYKIDQQAQ